VNLHNGEDAGDDIRNGMRLWATLLDALAGALEALGAEGWLVGGGVRDALLGRPVRDLDVAVSCEPLALGRALGERLPITLGALNRDSVRIGLPGAERQTSGPAPQLDLSPLHGPDIAADLRMRDFSINALALPLAAWRTLLGQQGAPVAALPDLVDPLGGAADLARRLLVPASSHALRDDPGRLVRAARLAASLGVVASPAARRAASDAAPQLPTLAPDRLRQEFSRLLVLPHAADGLTLLAEVGALTVLFPELGAEEAQRHALAAIGATAALQPGADDEASSSPDGAAGMAAVAALAPVRAWYAALLPDGQPRVVALRLGLLLHARGPHTLDGAEDVDNRDGEGHEATGMTQMTGMRRLRLPAPERSIVHEIDAHAAWTRRMLTEGMPDDATLRQIFEASGEVAVDVLVAAVACNEALGTAPVQEAEPSPEVANRAHAILNLYFSDRARLVPPRLLTGGDLILALGMPAGTGIGRALARIRQAQLDGEIGTREEALAYMRRLMEIGAPEQW
jgi:hypothetical protein